MPDIVSDTSKPVAQKEVLQVLSALAQSTRLEAFQLLSSAGEQGISAGDIARALGAPHNTLSTHLAILQNAGLLRSERKGRKMIYYVEPSSLGAMIDFLLRDCCGAKPEKCFSKLAENQR